MALVQLNLKSIYRNSSDNITDELLIPLLSESKSYYRGVGFFTSNWIKLVSKGIKSLVENDGKIYLITSLNLSTEDWEAVSIGNKAKVDNILYENIKRTIDEDFDIESKYDCLNLFSWLIADNILELKFALCNNKIGIYHDKVAIFQDDEENKICLHGSFNDSLQATYNGESMSVFRSWENGQLEYVEEHLNDFLNIWNNNDNFYNVMGISEAIVNEFKKYRTNDRPYKSKNKEKIHLPSFIKSLNDYQEDAINAIINNGWSGMLEMATGTGKTITSLSVTKKYFDEKQKIFLIVVVPFNHLIEQWQKNILEFGYDIPIKCNQSRRNWENRLRRTIRNYNSGISDVETIITTYSTFSSEAFQNCIKQIRKNSVLIADECHYAGSKNIRRSFTIDFDVKIGLSATPQRWFDDEGSIYIENYFKKVVFKYGLEEAIENDFLTEYYYNTEIIRLDEDEYCSYKELTKKIINLFKKGQEVELESPLQRLILKRAEIISKAKNKLPIFLEQIKEQYENGDICNTLVYCSKGESSKITKLISDLGILVHEFTYEVDNSDREKILKLFEKGEIQVLVAIKCLDEGVDIPNTKKAYFLSSTSNPREFVQRRGRILRKHKDKHKSYINDYIVFPPIGEEDISIDKSIIEKEMPRFAEFSRYCFNEFEEKNKIRKYLEPYNLEHLMEKLPWDLYKERGEKFE